ncbi:RPC31 [[Candida] subhashii]|uniref:DNA-directed RNA polymerase III subunit n=1 Tax=[Candida] subhashii TaxID=561895 RepID=A0A8J5QJI9_9ASCO|nr:RPC31 [[Candida] subhashii]KAG7663298.1 RPC31 [[Candida] subhashii]
MSFRNKNSGRALLPFGLDYSDVLTTTSGTDKPELVLPVNGDLTDNETAAAKQSIMFAKLMSDGPFYTGNLDFKELTDSEQQRAVVKAGNTAPDGIERYSDRYKKVQKIGRTIEEHPYQLEFFPEELYSVMGITNKQKKKLLSISTFKSNGGLREFKTGENKEGAEANSLLEKLKNMAEELDHGDENKEEGEDELEEDIDDEFDEDEDDDYNAEKYFDDGDDDGMDAGGDDEAAF